MSLFLASKYVVPSHIHSVFSGFCMISFSKHVNIACDYERAFNKRRGTLSVPGDSHFWDLINAALSSGAVMFSHSCSFSFSVFPIQFGVILQAFSFPHIPFQNFSILSFGGVSFTITLFFPISP